jgi:NTE family protein
VTGADTNGRRPTIALVLPGGGARGAYEAGALSVMLPALEARGERVQIVCGTSVGAINAALVGSLAARPAIEQAEAIAERWLSVRRQDVMARLVSPRLPLTALRILGETLGLPGLRLTNLLDPRPLRASLREWIDWDALHRNIARGHVRAVAVVATSLARGRPVVFVHGRTPLPRNREGDEVSYVKAVLAPEHVRASGAIPVLFPPVCVRTPRSAAGWYIDGSTRLNSPLKPALALGAERVLVIAMEPLLRRPHTRRDRGPHMSDVLANVLDGLLVDQVVDDVHRLARINTFFAEDSTTGPSLTTRAYRAARGRAPFRKISYAVVAPARHGTIAALAERHISRLGLLGALREPDLVLMSRLLGDANSARGELLSFVLFDPAFAEALIEAGRSDARRWLERHPGLWCTDPAHDLGAGIGDPSVLHETRAIEEFREARSRRPNAPGMPG